MMAGSPTMEVSQAFGVAPHVLRRWRRELTRFGEAAFPGNGRNRLVHKQRTLSLIFRLSAEEYSSVQSAYRASSARSLSEFVRAQVLSGKPDDSIVRLEETVQRLTEAVRGMSSRRPPAPEHIV